MKEYTPNQYWDYLLKSDRDRATQSHETMMRLVGKSDLGYSNSTLSCILKPDLIDISKEEDLKWSTKHLCSAIEKAIKVILADESHPWWSSIPPSLRSLMRIPTPLKRNIQIARLDGSFNRLNKLQYLECNSDSPAGFAYATVLQHAIMGTTISKEFNKKFKIKKENHLEKLCQTLLKLYQKVGTKKKPVVAIADWRNAKTVSEFKAVVTMFASMGIKAVICSPRDFDYKNGKLSLDGKTIDIVYRRVILSELAKRKATCKAFVKAAQEQAVLIVNPFASAIGSCKELLARLCMGEFDSVLNEDELNLVSNNIPFSYLLSSDEFRSGGRKYNTLDYTLKYREKLVVKPMRSYGGRGICFGRDYSLTKWKALIKSLHKNNYVCQRLIHLLKVQVPTFTPLLGFDSMISNTNPYVLNGHYIGCLTRLSKSHIVNVGAGGSIQPQLTLKK